MYVLFTLLGLLTHPALGQVDTIKNYKGLEGRLNIIKTGGDLEDSIIDCHPEGYLGFEPTVKGEIVVHCAGFKIYPRTNYVVRVPQLVGYHLITIRMNDIAEEIEDPLLNATIACEVLSLGDDDWLSHRIPANST